MRTTSAAVVVAAVLLAGCTAPTPRTDEEGRHLGHIDLGLTGPWADEFQRAYDEATDPFVRAVLMDGVVTDAEYAEMFDQWAQCMAEEEITLTELPPSEGGYRYTFPPSITADFAHEVETRCSEESGEYPIGALYTFVQRNPDNLDEMEILRDCLVREGVITDGYDQEKLERDIAASPTPFDDDPVALRKYNECNRDPLGLLP